MSAVETLREAAKVLRERAEAATPGPWHYAEAARGNPADGPTVVQVCDIDGPLLEGDYESGPGYAAALAATMHPGVAMALAAWLHAEAHHRSHDPSEHDGTPSGYALRVAEAILGGAR